MKIKATNARLLNLMRKLEESARKNKVRIWYKIMEDLSLKRRRAEVNLSKIDKYAEEGDTILIPGKVLGNGNLSKKITVSAFSFSKNALEKINRVGKAVYVEELIDENPKGSGIKILK